MEDIPPELLIKWHPTGLNLVPTSNWTMAQKGQKRVSIKGLRAQRMILVFFAGA